MDNTRILRISKTSLSALLIAFLLPPMAAQAAGTLQKINESGTISIGFRESAPPFSYLSADRQAIGYSVDICVKITEAIKRELKRSNLTVK